LENVPPLEDFHITAQVPSTPKRRKSTSHYSDVDCSPSKKRDYLAGRVKSSEEGALLFGDTTNNRALEMDGDAPIESSQSIRGKATKGPQRAKVGRKEVVDVFD